MWSLFMLHDQRRAGYGGTNATSVGLSMVNVGAERPFKAQALVRVAVQENPTSMSARHIRKSGVLHRATLIDLPQPPSLAMTTEESFPLSSLADTFPTEVPRLLCIFSPVRVKNGEPFLLKEALKETAMTPGLGDPNPRTF